MERENGQGHPEKPSRLFTYLIGVAVVLVIIGGIMMIAPTAAASSCHLGKRRSMSASSSMTNPSCSATGRINRHTSIA